MTRFLELIPIFVGLLLVTIPFAEMKLLPYLFIIYFTSLVLCWMLEAFYIKFKYHPTIIMLIDNEILINGAKFSESEISKISNIGPQGYFWSFDIFKVELGAGNKFTCIGKSKNPLNPLSESLTKKELRLLNPDAFLD